jgi:hypothetical protein
MKYFSLIILFLLLSCGNKEDILLPKSNVTIVKTIDDLSPVYIFFRTKEKDTLAEVNRKNTISTTNWVFNIDKRLPLRIVIPEIMKLQDKRRKDSAHKKEDAQNYYSYADSVGKNLAFIPFTDVYYKMEKPKSGVVVFFTKHNEIQVNKVVVKKEELQGYLNNLQGNNSNGVVLCFDKELSFGVYLQYKILIKSLKFSIPELNIDGQEFVY